MVWGPDPTIVVYMDHCLVLSCWNHMCATRSSRFRRRVQTFRNFLGFQELLVFWGGYFRVRLPDVLVFVFEVKVASFGGYVRLQSALGVFGAV